MKKTLAMIIALLLIITGCGQNTENKILADGEYVCEVSLEGGSGKATVESPTEVVVKDGKIKVVVTWSSSNYDYMIVDGQKFLNEASAGEKSKFTIPVPEFDRAFTVIADTTAMSTPHEIEYRLNVHGTGEKDISSKESTAPVMNLGRASTEGLSLTGSLELKYAKEFKVDFYEDSEKNRYNFITIGSGDLEQSFLQSCSDAASQYETIKTDKTYLVSTSVMDLIASIGALDSIRLSGTKKEDWSIEEAKKAMESGSLLYAGKYSAPDYELLLSEGCNFAIENTMIYHNPEVYEKLKSLGITVMIERSSYESDPLGRLEWVKLYGVIYNKLDEATALFDEQEKRVNEVKAKEKTGKSVAVFSINSNGTVTVRRNGDYISSMIDLAGGIYVPKGLTDEEDSNLSTMNITVEDFYAGAKDADLLIYNGTIEGNIDRKKELTEKMPLLGEFKAFKSGMIYCLPESFFQQSTSAADFIEDVNNILEGDTKKLSFLYRLEE